PLDQRRREPGRIDQEIPAPATQQVALRAIGRFAGVAASVDRTLEMDGEVPGGLLRAALRADRRRRAAHHGVQRAPPGRLVPRLPLHEGLPGLQAPEDVGRKLATGVALDARLVDVELAWNILGDRQVPPRHPRVVTARFPPREARRHRSIAGGPYPWSAPAAMMPP